MATELFIAKKFSAAHEHVIHQANRIIEEFMADGYTLTLRQLHYQFVSKDFYHNTQANYKRLGKILDAARKAGLVDWDAIEDRTRFVRRIPVYDGPEEPLHSIAEKFKLDPWDHQPTKRRIEVWIEKDALVGVIQRVCDRYRLPYFSCRGYSSSSEMYAAGKRLAAWRSHGYDVRVLHLGDHDPSGVQMSEDNTDRLELFGREEIPLYRLALNMEQIRELGNLPPNFAKQTDSRTKWYIDRYGTDDAWELDALSPKYIENLISEHVDPLIDQEAWDATMTEEQEHIRVFQEIISDWDRTKAAPKMAEFVQECATLEYDGCEDAQQTVVDTANRASELIQDYNL